MSANKNDEHEVGIGELGIWMGNGHVNCRSKWSLYQSLALCVDNLNGLSSLPTESQVHQCTLKGRCHMMMMGMMPHESTCIGTALVVSISTLRAWHIWTILNFQLLIIYKMPDTYELFYQSLVINYLQHAWHTASPVPPSCNKATSTLSIAITCRVVLMIRWTVVIMGRKKILTIMRLITTSTSPSQGELTPAFVFHGRAPPL